VDEPAGRAAIPRDGLVGPRCIRIVKTIDDCGRVWLTRLVTAPTNLSELNPTLSEGRLKWETTSAGEMIRMFAAAGYDVVRNDVMPDRNGCFNRLVMVDGRIVAFVLWCDSVPNYAYAYTASV
jgi:hypothetical protein